MEKAEKETRKKHRKGKIEKHQRASRSFQKEVKRVSSTQKNRKEHTGRMKFKIQGMWLGCIHIFLRAWVRCGFDRLNL